MSTLYELREREDQVPPYVLPAGVKPKRRSALEVAEEIGFFGWYYNAPRDDTAIGWSPEFRNWMAERLRMNRETLDRAILRARQLQTEEIGDVDRIPPAPGVHRQ